MDQIAQDYSELLLALVVWREAANQPYEGRLGVACSIRNRVKAAGWMGKTYAEVITKPAQYSSFPWWNGKAIPPRYEIDAVGIKFPNPSDPIGWQAFTEILEISRNVVRDIAQDNVGGANSYFDGRLDKNPPAWAKASAEHTIDIADLRFWKV